MVKQNIEAVIKACSNYLRTKWALDSDSYEKAKLYVAKLSDFTRQDFDKFIQNINQFEHYKKFHKIGFYVSALIDKIVNPSDKFVLDLSGIEKKKVDNLGYKAKGIELEINGDVGDDLIAYAENVKVKLNGNAESNVASRAKNCQVFIEKNVGVFCGNESENCKFNVCGSVGNIALQEANNSEAVIYGNAGSQLLREAKNCKVLVKGGIGDMAALLADNITLEVEGNAGYWIAPFAENSKIAVKGEIGSISKELPASTEFYSQGQRVVTPKRSEGKVLIMSYHDVMDFPTGVYGNGNLIVYTPEKDPYEKEKMKEEMSKLAHDLWHKVDLDEIKKAYVYAGLHAKERALSAAESLNSHLGKDNVTLVACDCDWSQKKEFAKQQGIDLIQSDCGGRYMLGKIAHYVLKETEKK